MHAQHAHTSGLTYPAGYENGQWRNLRPSVDGTAVPLTYAKGTNDPTLDIFEHDGDLGQVAVHYSADNVDFNEPTAGASAYAAFCKACHTDFHGSSSDANMHDADGWLRHPTADRNIGEAGMAHISSLDQYNSHTNKVKVMVGTAADDYTPSCFSCHKAHGNQNAFGLIYMRGTGTVTEQGDDGNAARDLCRQCHIQG